jgi:hypothetical protein
VTASTLGGRRTAAAARERGAERDRGGGKEGEKGGGGAVVGQRACRRAAGDRQQRAGHDHDQWDERVLDEHPADRRAQEHADAPGLVDLRSQRLEQPRGAGVDCQRAGADGHRMGGVDQADRGPAGGQRECLAEPLPDGQSGDRVAPGNGQPR